MQSQTRDFHRLQSATSPPTRHGRRNSRSQRPKMKANTELEAGNNSPTSLMTTPAMDQTTLHLLVR